MEMRCYRRILRISYKDHVTKELAKLVERLDKASTAYGMEINAEKTKLMDPHSTAPKNNTSHRNEVLPQDT